MAQDEEFRIKGAAERRASQESNELHEDQPKAADEENPHDAADQAEEAQENLAAEQDNDSPKSYDDDDRLECSYTWYEVACPVPGPNGETHYYWNKASDQTTYIEPDNKYWIFDPNTQGRDKSKGLQEAGSAEARREAEKPPYMGYNPAIHGDYDPNADYAKWHQQKHAAEDAARSAQRLPYGNPGGVMGGGGYGPGPSAGGYGYGYGYGQDPAAGAPGADYTSTLGFNRATGHAQQSHLDPSRHTDAAKSGRQMNAFFDTEAAANAHDGRSLKEERRNVKFTKAELAEIKKNRQEKKQKKRREWLKS